MGLVTVLLYPNHVLYKVVSSHSTFVGTIGTSRRGIDAYDTSGCFDR